jgi:hypothetical protein
MDVSKLAAAGWKFSIPLEQGLQTVYREFVINEQQKTNIAR